MAPGAEAAGAVPGRAAEVEASACAAIDADPVAACCTAVCAVAEALGAAAGDVSAGGAVASPLSAGVGVETVAPPPSTGSAAGAGSAADAGSVEVDVLGSVVVASVEAWLGIAESSSVERTWSPAAAENAAPATKRAANVSAAATCRVPERRFGTSAAETGGSASSSPFLSHSSHARP